MLRATAEVLAANKIPFELLVVDDYSTDNTAEKAHGALTGAGTVRCIQNVKAPGFGNAIECGISQARGEILAIMMGDGSDSPSDLVDYYRAIVAGADCAFGSRFLNKSNLEGYPPLKLLLNRLGNWLVASVFGYRYTDFTNAFKAYRTSVLNGILPLHSQGFEVTLELPIRAVQSGASFRVMPISWRGRTSGQSKMETFVEMWRYLQRLVLLRLESL